jgi:hypothetical protein
MSPPTANSATWEKIMTDTSAPRKRPFRLTPAPVLPKPVLNSKNAPTARATSQPADPPEVTLEEDPDVDSSTSLSTLGLRSGVQQQRLEELITGDPKYTIEPTSLIFDQPHTWAYRCFKVTAPTSDADRFQDSLYLFNVIVALEWSPSQLYLNMLTRAFQRASDFLYDVTDGYMAFGQVAFGGLELMSCADIQIMASNRLLPRSWVGGLHPPLPDWPEKYMPIRIGRGLWQKNNRVSIDWDEPDGFQTLIHEWAHYALELLDAYLETHDVYLPPKPDRADTDSPVLIRAKHTVIVPRISLAVDSIMSTLRGTSELVPKNDSGPDSKNKEWERIVEKQRYPKVQAKHRSIDGPTPIRELPQFALVYSAPVSGSRTATVGAEKSSKELILYDFPTDIQPEHCWVYLLKHDPKNLNPNSTLLYPQYIVAQGTLDARALSDGFRLLGAESDDVIVLIGNNESKQIVLQSAITETETQAGRSANTDGTRTASVAWNNITPESFPIIDVVPKDAAHDGTRAPADLDVRVYWREPAPATDATAAEHSGKNVPVPNAEITVFSLGYIGGQSIPAKPAALDGHVLVKWRDQMDDRLIINTFSQGGGPPTGTPTGPPPISAGSSEGNVMLFFEDKGLRPDYSKVRIVTTRLYGVPYELPTHAQARGYGFSLSSTTPLPIELNPTIVMYYDKSAELADGDAIIHQQADDGTWIPIPTYRPAEAWYVAAPLNADTAKKLVSLDIKSPQDRVEHYRLYWVPQAGATATSDTAKTTEATAKGNADLNGA